MQKNQISFTPDADVKSLIEQCQKLWGVNQSKTINRILLAFKKEVNGINN